MIQFTEPPELLYKKGRFTHGGTTTNHRKKSIQNHDRNFEDTWTSTGFNHRRRHVSFLARIARAQNSKRAKFSRSISRGKRALDLALGAVILAVSAPTFLLTVVLIKLVSPGPVFFKQQRIGYRGKPFTLWKFRTMHQNATTKNHEAHVKALMKSGKPMTKLDTKDARIIPFGNILRQTGIDELPQLINVLKGEMSLVGPRPCLAGEAELFNYAERERFNALPGMTGLWQVSGKNKLTFSEMIEMDVEYARNASIILDLAIMLRTIPAILGLVADYWKMKQPQNKSITSSHKAARTAA